jgi:2-amino-4-hydroxy-6-hydroxymethyldihydropteridine diphosphokinase
MRLMAYIGIGSNLDNPVVQVQEAIEELGAIPDSLLIARSSLYSSKPMGAADQPNYVNAVVAIDTVLSPQALLQVLQAIERRRGRERTGEKWGPRVLDLDLLLYGGRRIDTADLTIPHPGLHERDFVLVPLGEIAGDISIPGRGRLSAFMSRCDNHALRKLVTV